MLIQTHCSVIIPSQNLIWVPRLAAPSAPASTAAAADYHARRALVFPLAIIVFSFKLYLVALLQFRSVQNRTMNKRVLAAIVWGDESKSLLVHPLLHGACWHVGMRGQDVC